MAGVNRKVSQKRQHWNWDVKAKRLWVGRNESVSILKRTRTK